MLLMTNTLATLAHQFMYCRSWQICILFITHCKYFRGRAAYYLNAEKNSFLSASSSTYTSGRKLYSESESVLLVSHILLNFLGFFFRFTVSNYIVPSFGSYTGMSCRSVQFMSLKLRHNFNQCQSSSVRAFSVYITIFELLQKNQEYFFPSYFTKNVLFIACTFIQKSRK